MKSLLRHDTISISVCARNSKHSILSNFLLAIFTISFLLTIVKSQKDNFYSYYVATFYAMALSIFILSLITMVVSKRKTYKISLKDGSIDGEILKWANRDSKQIYENIYEECSSKYEGVSKQEN